jgi:hypothetical protein
MPPPPWLDNRLCLPTQHSHPAQIIFGALPTNPVTYNVADSQVVVAYANNKAEMSTLSGASGVTLAIKPAANYISDASMVNLMQGISDRLNNLGLAAFFCNNASILSTNQYYRTVFRYDFTVSLEQESIPVQVAAILPLSLRTLWNLRS